MLNSRNNRFQPVLWLSRTLNGLRVLIVDDNATNREILEHYTRSCNMRSDSASSGRQALEMMRSASALDPYELAIVDMQMPEMDGLMLGHAIKSDPAIASTQLVMLTSLWKSTRYRRHEAGGDRGLRALPVGDCACSTVWPR